MRTEPASEGSAANRAKHDAVFMAETIAASVSRLFPLGKRATGLRSLQRIATQPGCLYEKRRTWSVATDRKRVFRPSADRRNRIKRGLAVFPCSRGAVQERSCLTGKSAIGIRPFIEKLWLRARMH